MSKGTVRTIVEKMRERTSKAGYEYKAMKVEVEIDNGEAATILSFDPLEVGDEVQLTKNGEYWNVDKPKKNDNGDALQAIYLQQKQIIERLDKLTELVSDQTKTSVTIPDDDFPPDFLKD